MLCRPHKQCLLLLTAALACLLWSHAGELDDFERSLNKKRVRTDRRVRSHDGDDWADELIADCIMGLIGECLLVPFSGVAAAEGTGNAIEFWDERDPGWPTIPMLRLDTAYQNVNGSDIEAVDHTFEIGWGPVAAEFNHTYYWEDEPPDHLNIFQALFLWRMPASPNFEMDLALGNTMVEGNSSTNSFTIGFPARLWVNEHVGIEGRLMWTSLDGGSITDHRIGGVLRYEFASIKAGYRYRKSDEESLSGPYIGLSFRY